MRIIGPGGRKAQTRYIHPRPSERCPRCERSQIRCLVEAPGNRGHPRSRGDHYLRNCLTRLRRIPFWWRRRTRARPTTRSFKSVLGCILPGSRAAAKDTATCERGKRVRCGRNGHRFKPALYGPIERVFGWPVLRRGSESGRPAPRHRSRTLQHPRSRSESAVAPSSTRLPVAACFCPSHRLRAVLARGYGRGFQFR